MIGLSFALAVTLLGSSTVSAQDILTAEGNRLLNYATSVRNQAARTGLEAAQASDRGDYLSACTLFTKSVEQWGDAERALVKAIQPAFMVGQSREVDAMVDDRIADNKRGLLAALSAKSSACGYHASAPAVSSGGVTTNDALTGAELASYQAVRSDPEKFATIIQSEINTAYLNANDAVVNYRNGRLHEACASSKLATAAYAKAGGRNKRDYEFITYSAEQLQANIKQASVDEIAFFCKAIGNAPPLVPESATEDYRIKEIRRRGVDAKALHQLAKMQYEAANYAESCANFKAATEQWSQAQVLYKAYIYSGDNPQLDLAVYDIFKENRVSEETNVKMTCTKAENAQSKEKLPNFQISTPYMNNSASDKFGDIQQQITAMFAMFSAMRDENNNKIIMWDGRANLLYKACLGKGRYTGWELTGSAVRICDAMIILNNPMRYDETDDFCRDMSESKSNLEYLAGYATPPELRNITLVIEALYSGDICANSRFIPLNTLGFGATGLLQHGSRTVVVTKPFPLRPARRP